MSTNPVHACPSCKQPMPNTARFCSACGTAQFAEPVRAGEDQVDRLARKIAEHNDRLARQRYNEMNAPYTWATFPLGYKIVFFLALAAFIAVNIGYCGHR